MGIFGTKNIFPCNNCPESELTPAQIDALPISKTITIPSADVLTAYANPVVLIPSSEAGVGKAIEVLSCVCKIDWNSVVYNKTFVIASDSSTAALYLFGFGSLHSATTNAIGAGIPFQSSANGNMFENDAIVFKTLLSNPTQGDSDITIYITYRIITL